MVRLRTVGTHWEEQDGKQVEVPGLGLGPEDIQVERAPDGHTGRVRHRLHPDGEAQAAGPLLDPIHFLAERSGVLRP